jgi:hypothetical protein
MLELFTVEEINLMCIFDISSRNALIDELSAAIPDFDEPELTEIAENVLAKLNTLNDEDFSALDFYPEYEDYDEESEV